MENFCIGIDVAKLTFVAAIDVNSKHKTKTFDNCPKGFVAFFEWLRNFSDKQYHCCMESTGKYGNALALFLYQNNSFVSIINPAKIKYFMKSMLARNKTDAVDAKLICNYCKLFNPSLWKPASSEIQILQVLIKRVDALTKMRAQEKNRLENIELLIKESVHNHINYLDNEINNTEKLINTHINSHPSLVQDYKLLKTIPGIGDKTIHRTLAFLSNIKTFDKAKQVAAFIGINPQHAQSGTSLNHSHISKTGDSELRKMLYMPALVAARHEPSIKVFYEKLVAKGKPKKVAVCAVMRKLVHIIYGVLKSQKPFNAELIRAADTI